MIAVRTVPAADTSSAPQDPKSDPENKLGRTPPADWLNRETELQRSGAATRGSIINANTPGPNQRGGDTTRDPEIEHRTP